jgi:hypothetical protein
LQSHFAIITCFSRSKYENFKLEKIMKKLITPIAIATLSCNAAFAQAVVAAAGEEQITTTTTVTRRIAAAAAAPVPVAAAPTPAPTPEVDYTAAVKRYVVDYVRAGESTAESAALELAFFADHVDYFDNGIVDRAFIAKDVRDYAARWPDRTFRIEGNNIALRAINDNTVRAEFVLQYSVRNTKKLIRGAVASVLLIDFSKGEPQIVSVKSNTISRREFPAVAM